MFPEVLHVCDDDLESVIVPVSTLDQVREFIESLLNNDSDVKDVKDSDNNNNNNVDDISRWVRTLKLKLILPSTSPSL